MEANSSRELIQKMRRGEKCLVGMVHCLPLPGTLGFGGDMEEIFRRAKADADTLAKAGVDAVIVENTNDKPNAVRLEPEQIAALAALTRVVVERVKVPVGVDASFNDGVAAISIARVAGASFIRCAVMVDNMQATGIGDMRPCAKELIRYRRLLQGENIGIWADVQVKHTHPILEAVPLEESAAEAMACGAEALIVTGASTGMETPLEAVKRVKKAVPLPVVIGSGFSLSNAPEQLETADGAIVGTALKVSRNTMDPVDPVLTAELVAEIRRVEQALAGKGRSR